MTSSTLSAVAIALCALLSSSIVLGVDVNIKELRPVSDVHSTLPFQIRVVASEDGQASFELTTPYPVEMIHNFINFQEQDDGTLILSMQPWMMLDPERKQPTGILRVAQGALIGLAASQQAWVHLDGAAAIDSMFDLTSSNAAQIFVENAFFTSFRATSSETATMAVSGPAFDFIHYESSGGTSTRFDGVTGRVELEMREAADLIINSTSDASITGTVEDIAKVSYTGGSCSVTTGANNSDFACTQVTE